MAIGAACTATLIGGPIMDNRFKWLSILLQLLVFIPGAASCYLSAKKQMKFTPGKTAVLCAALLLPYSLVFAALHVLLDIDTYVMFLPSLILFFFLYRRTVSLDLPWALAIFTGVCAIGTFPAQFAYSLDAALHPASGAANLSPEGALFQLVLSFLLLTTFFYPATRHFSRAVDTLDVPKVWHSTTILSSLFLIFNILAVPRSYSTLYAGRMKWLFPVFEGVALAVLVAIYLLFYQGSIVILEHTALKERARLLEIQSHQYHALQEHMRQTARLRHDFRHSVRLLASLAEHDDIDSIRKHLAEYQVSIDDNIIVNYSKNAALNALFGYYQEMASSADIETDWRIVLPDPLPFPELDMAALFGNLLENAIAGCRTLPSGPRYFCLTAEIRHGNRLYVVSTNNFDGNVKKDKAGYRSTRHNGVGTGLASIAAVAEKYGGAAKASNNDREFFVDVVLKL